MDNKRNFSENEIRVSTSLSFQTKCTEEAGTPAWDI